jgi:hypothetical protein
MFCYIEEQYFVPQMHYGIGHLCVAVMIDIDDHTVHLRLRELNECEPKERALMVVPNYLEATVLLDQVQKDINLESERTQHCPAILDDMCEALEISIAAHKSFIGQV